MNIANIQNSSSITRDKLVNYQQEDLNQLKENNLIISNISQITSFVNNIKQINENINIIVTVTSAEIFNNLCLELNRLKPLKKIIIYISSDIKLNRNTKLDFKLLPDNVKVTNVQENSVGEKDNNFEWWALWLNNKDYKCILKKLTPYAAYRLQTLRNIVDSFYKKYPGLDSLTAWEKANFVFAWCQDNISYDYKVLNKDKSSQDPIYTFIYKKGDSRGQARLFKVLLNNRLMQVNCFLTKEIDDSHEFNEIYYDNGDVLYYDLTYDIKNNSSLDITKNLNHQDALEKEFKLIPKIKKKD